MTSATQTATIQTTSFQIGEKTITVESGRFARSAKAGITIRCEDTVVFIAIAGSEKPRAGIDFFPLLVDYEEKMFSVGRFPGGYLKKEGRPSERAILTARLIDRPVRPLWPDGYRNDVQIVASPMSLDSVNPPDVLAILGASFGLTLSGLPFKGPIGAVRVGRVEGQFILNPTHNQIDKGDLDLVVSGTADSIMMVEAGAKFVSEEDLLAALELAHTSIKEQVKAQEAFRAQCGVVQKEYVFPHDLSPLYNFIDGLIHEDVHKAYHNFDREQRQEILETAKTKMKEAIAALPEDNPIKQFTLTMEIDYVAETFKKIEKKIMRAMVIEEGVRADGRKQDEIRPITCDVGLLPRTHGSGLFTRGSTQALSLCTLGSPGDAQELDGVDPQREKRWIHHYSFPGFSVGEVRPLRGAGRREIGHGALAERGIAPILPTKDKFAYTIRVNSEVLESNGSTSMASTCGAVLALMDAGVPIKEPVGGIAMGLIKEGSDYVVLSDIQGVEDFLGDMDFKVVGTRSGVTALQMDIKIQGISLEIMKQALEQARVGRLHIMDKMAEAIAEPRTEMSPWAPRIFTLFIETDQIGTVIGPGGKMIRSIIDATGATIDIEDSGQVTITSIEAEGGLEAKRMIERLTMKIEPGLLSVGKVVRILPGVGAFVEIVPGKDGMVHISQLLHQRVATVEEVLSVGDRVCVKVAGIDERGRVNLTMKGVTDEERAQLGFPPHPPRPEPQPQA
jgi:polyribonucleotide nucleotidyltransferase